MKWLNLQFFVCFALIHAIEFWITSKTELQLQSSPKAPISTYWVMNISETINWFSSELKRENEKTCLRWPPKAPISSSIDTNVPAKVPRKRPYLKVSFRDATITSPFVKTTSFLNKQTKRNQLPQSQISTSSTSSHFHFSNLGGFFRANRAKIAKRARPPLRPAPIEKPFAEAITTLLSFSGGTARTIPRRKRGIDGAVEGRSVSADATSSLQKPLISSVRYRWMSSESVADGDMVAEEGESECRAWGEVISKRQGNDNEDERCVIIRLFYY